MGKGARVWIAMGLLGASSAACSTLAGIEDLGLTGAPDASTDGLTSAGDATVESGVADARVEAGDAGVCSSGQTRCSGEAVEICLGSQWGSPVACASGSCVGGACAGACATGQVQCSGNGVQSCGSGGQWGPPASCVDQTCANGACTGACAPGQTNPVPCGNCGTDTQTCSPSGAWQTSGTCSAGGACAPGASQTCNTYGTQTCAATCAWGACSCGSAPACSPGTSQCAGPDLETCGGCGQYGPAVACASGTCVGGVCAGSCTANQKQCSGNGVESCASGQWGPPVSCGNQTCVSGACTGVCAPGQTDPVACGRCGTDTQTCSASGTWQTSGSCPGQGACGSGAMQTCNTYGTQTCSSSCAWGSCSCASTPVCTPGAKQCSGTGVQTCSACGQWGNPASCGSGMTCSGSGTCVGAATDCPGGFLLCDGFESGSINPALWDHTPNDGNQTLTVDTTNPHHGAYALHVHIGALNNGAFVESHIHETVTFPSNVLYIRAFYSLSALPGPDDDVLISLQSDANQQSASGAVGFLKAGFFSSGVSNTSGNTYDYYTTSATKIPTGTGAAAWTCVELEIDTSYDAPNPNGLLQVWHDSTAVDPKMIGTAELQPLAGAAFGLDFGAPSGGTATTPVDLYVDDIAIDTRYIDCSQ